MPEFISILRWIRDIVYPKAVELETTISNLPDQITGGYSQNYIDNTVRDLTKNVKTIDALLLEDGLVHKALIVEDINRGGTFVSKKVIEIDPNTGSLYELNDGTVFTKLGGGFWVRQYSGAANVKWFNAKGDGVTDDSIAVQKAIDSNEKVKFPKGTYLINIELNKYFELYGDGLLETIIKPYSTSTPAILNMYQEPDWRATSINNIGFESTLQTGIGFSYGDYENYTPGQELIGRVIFNLCSFKGLDKGVRKSFGNIGNVYNQCYFQWNNYGVWAKDAQSSNPSSSIMHTGCDTYNGGEFHENKKAAALYMENCGGYGQITFNQTVMEYNGGFGVRFETTIGNAWNPIVFNNVWEEGNATATSVTIDTLTGVQTLIPKSIDIVGIRNGFHKYGNQVGLDTLNPGATLGIYRNQEWALNLIAGNGIGIKYNGIKFSDYGTEHISGAGISATTTGITTEKTLFLESNNTKIIAVEPTGTTKIGNTAVQYGGNIAGSHVIFSTYEVGGENILKVGSRFSQNHSFNISDGSASNGAKCSYSLGAVISSGRSINAGGTINASGADYAEYEYNSGIKFKKGDIVGFKEDGTITNKYSEAIRFAIKSTNPSYVGGDIWGSESIVGKKPEYPFRKIDIMEKVTKEDGTIEDEIVDKGYTQEEWELILLDYENEVKEFEAKLETERQKVDRIAYSGKVPVNIYYAIPGQYIVAIEKDGVIDGLLVNKSEMTFSQYQDAVGRVNKILDDGRAEVAVIIH